MADLVKNLKLSLDDNFNDLALRLTNLGATNEFIKSSISASANHTTEVKEELISALSSIDKNILTQFNINFNVILQKLNAKCTSHDLESFSNKMIETIDRNSKSEKEILLLQVENKKLMESNTRAEKQVSLLNVRLETKVDVIKKLDDKIISLKAENAEVTNSQLSIINDLQGEKDKLIKELENSNADHAKSVQEYQKKLETSMKLAKQVEEKNIRLFNQEKKKVECLLQRLNAFDKTCEKMKTEKDTMQKELDKSKNSNKVILDELTELKNTYEIENKKVKDMMARFNETSNQLGSSNADIHLLKSTYKETECCIADLNESLKNKERDLADYKEKLDKFRHTAEQAMQEKNEEIAKLKDDFEKLCRAKSRKLFSESRTSTVVKTEEAKPHAEVKAEVEQNKDVKPKRVTARKKIEKKVESSSGKDLIRPKTKKPSVITKVAKPKRKLISSSQSSVKSSQLLKEKKQQELTKNILHDLDIFNEFEAIDKLETIVKPGW